MSEHHLRKIIATIAILLCPVQVLHGQQKPVKINANKQVTECPSSKYVLEPAKCIPVAYDADVVVTGGGFSGIAAALAAARQGAKTVLIERQRTVGGSFGPGMHFQSRFLQDDPNSFSKGAPYDYVKGEYTLTMPECYKGKMFDDCTAKSATDQRETLCRRTTLSLLRASTTAASTPVMLFGSTSRFGHTNSPRSCLATSLNAPSRGKLRSSHRQTRRNSSSVTRVPR